MFLRQRTQFSSSSRSRTREISTIVCSQLLVVFARILLQMIHGRRFQEGKCPVDPYSFVKSKLLISSSSSVSNWRRSNISTWWMGSQNATEGRDTFDQFRQRKESDLRQLHRYSGIYCAENVMTEDAFDSLSWPTGLLALAMYRKCVHRKWRWCRAHPKSRASGMLGSTKASSFQLVLSSRVWLSATSFFLRLDLTKKQMQSTNKKIENDKFRLSSILGNVTVLRSGLTKKYLQTMKEVRMYCSDVRHWQQFGFRHLSWGQTTWFDTSRNMCKLSVNWRFFFRSASRQLDYVRDVLLWELSCLLNVKWTTCDKDASRRSCDGEVYFENRFAVHFKSMRSIFSAEYVSNTFANIEISKWFLREETVSSRI